MAKSTKVNKCQENEPEPPRVLSGPQIAVIGFMLEGKRQGEAAELAGVAPETVSRWVRGDALFLAELNGRRAELWQSQASRLRNMAGKAVDVLEGLLADESASPGVRLAAAREVLKCLALADIGKPSGEIDAERLEYDMQRSKRLEAAKRRQDELMEAFL